MTEITTNPANHFYFAGFKIYLPKFEIIRKLYRNRKQDHADFLMLTSLYPEIISEFVRLHEGKLIYDISDKKIKEPIFNHNYLKILFNMIYNRYTKSDVNKFKQIVQII
jgi:hypothetical protein